MAEKTPLGPRAERKAESDEEAEENGDAGFLLSMLKQENLAESPVYNQVAPRHDPWRQGMGLGMRGGGAQLTRRWKSQCCRPRGPF